jgi:predicted metal-dependent hydrolase
MMESIQFGSQTIQFKVEFTSRKSLGITVTPDMAVMVKAPLDASMDQIRQKIKKKAPWILIQKSFFLGFHPKTPIRHFVSGETHLYLGRQYRLKIIPGHEECVKIRGQFIEVIISKKSTVQDIVQQWYLSKAKTRITEIAKPIIAAFKHHKVAPSAILFRNMSSRWGSCTPTGKIILNPELIKAPKRCIEYVIIHELCHLVHHDHTQRFIDLQTKEMPDWAKWKRKLEKLLA